MTRKCSGRTAHTATCDNTVALDAKMRKWKSGFTSLELFVCWYLGLCWNISPLRPQRSEIIYETVRI